MPPLQRLPGLLLTELGVLSASFCYKSMVLTHSQLLIHQVLQVLFCSTDFCTAYPQPSAQGPWFNSPCQDFSWFRSLFHWVQCQPFCWSELFVGNKARDNLSKGLPASPSLGSCFQAEALALGLCLSDTAAVLQLCQCPVSYLPDPDLLAWFPGLTLNLPHHNRLAVWSLDPGWHWPLFPGI